MSQEKVYFIIESEDYDDKRFGFAFSSPEIIPREIQNWPENKLWQPLVLELRDGGFPDYLINDLNIPLFSKELKITIDKYAGNIDILKWYPVEVIDTKHTKPYYFLKLTILNDVIDINKSQKQHSVILNPYFIKEKIEDIFKCDYDESHLFITDHLKEKIQNYSGLDFETWDEITIDQENQRKYIYNDGSRFYKDEDGNLIEDN